MLVQRRDGALRLITQHDHGLLAGRLAAAHDPALPLAVVLATALHDAGWRELDAVPAPDPASGEPLSFDRYPAEEKFVAAASWLDELETLHPYAAVLVSRHYTTFGSGEEGPFHRREETRREQLRRGRPDLFPPEEVEERHLALLRFFDNLSLLLCLTPPGAEREALPPWLDEGLLRRPDGTPVRMRWRDASEPEVLLDPFPFGGPLGLRIPHREVPRDLPREEWRDAFERARRVVRTVRVRPG